MRYTRKKKALFKHTLQRTDISGSIFFLPGQYYYYTRTYVIFYTFRYHDCTVFLQPELNIAKKHQSPAAKSVI